MLIGGGNQFALAAGVLLRIRGRRQLVSKGIRKNQIPHRTDQLLRPIAAPGPQTASKASDSRLELSPLSANEPLTGSFDSKIPKPGGLDRSADGC